jgi:hypothetical protein
MIMILYWWQFSILMSSGSIGYLQWGTWHFYARNDCSNADSNIMYFLHLQSYFHCLFPFCHLLILRGVRGRAVKVVDFKPLAPYCCGFESRQGLLILSCEEAIQLAYGTSVGLLWCPLVSKKIHGRTPEVLLHQ